MTWFKKSIAYDQKRKLFVLSILMTLGIIYSIIDSVSNAISRNSIYYGIYSLTIGLPETTYITIMGMTALMALISVGIRDKHETSYISSMPMKNYHVNLTKITCASISVLIPLIIGFIVNSIAFFINKSTLIELGFIYKEIVYKYLSISIIILIIISIIYLGNFMYNNIKVPAVLFVIGAISFVSLIIFLGECFKYDSGFRVGLNQILGDIESIIKIPIDNAAVYYPDTIGRIVILLGILVLIATIVNFIISNFENDIYDNVFAFKISKVISYVALVLTMIAIVSGIASSLVYMMYIQPMQRGASALDEATMNNIYLLKERLCLGLGVILTPLWIILSKKINKKIEERF